MKKLIWLCTPVSLAFVTACTTFQPSEPPPPPPLTAAPPEVSQADLCADKSFPVYFASDQSTLDETALAAIDTIVEAAKGCELSAVEISGHTDTVGSRKVNLAVSQRRADAVLKAILDANLDIERVEVVALGEEDGKTEDGLINPMNRKVDVFFRAK